MVLGAAIALSPGTQAAQEPFCRPQRVPKPTRMQAYQEVRRRYGFRSDRAYVRRLIRRGSIRTVDVERFPMTLREKRYIQVRDRLDLGAHADRYLRRRPGVDGGTSIEDAWPRAPYILVRLTRDRAEHARAIRRIALQPRHVRFKLVELSERDLGRLQNRIDWRAAERDGIYVSGSAPDIDTSTVEVEVITARTDATQYLQERYGPHVRAVVIATERYSPRCRSLWDYVAKGTRLTVGWEAGGDAKFDHVEVTETGDRVTVGVVVQDYNGVQTSDSRRSDAVIELSRPLGTRTVIDATTGKPIGPRNDPF